MDEPNDATSRLLVGQFRQALQACRVPGQLLAVSMLLGEKRSEMLPDDVRLIETAIRIYKNRLEGL